MKYFLIMILCACSAFAQYSPNEAVASVIIREAGGEGHTGMWAVANVIQNRANNKSTFDVVAAPNQFSSVSSVVVTHKFTWEKIIELSKKHPEWPRALDLAKKIESKSLPDITGGATNFFSGNVKPKWAERMTQTAHIGGHYFWKEK